ncbi:BamA/TamA family outer membrane protein [Ascidiimonas sp. W6]|uniref:translocation and assembly module lipoprotein TamL n=1 Tax=Ascidiimonas meishanensis TaxID=3128903 RepID=UPI0030ECBEA4
MKHLLAKIAVIFLIISLTACNAVKRVNDDELLLTQNTIIVNDEKIKDDDLNSLLYQKPNSKILGIPLRLHIYNFAKKNPDSSFLNWLAKNPKRLKRLENRFSGKQVVQMKHSFSGINNWIKETGEAPVVIDPKKAEKSAKRLRLYYESRGYLQNEADFKIDSSNQHKKKKRGTINYTVKTGDPYFLDSISHNIISKDLDSLYKLYEKESLIKKGDQFNVLTFEAERNRLTNIFANSGIYRFQPTSINFDVKIDSTPGSKDYKLPITLQISNFFDRVDGQLIENEYKIHTVKNVNIYADYNFNENRDSLKYLDFDNYRIFYKDKLRYRPETLTNVMAIVPGDVYKEKNRMVTNQQIGNLRTFKYPNIEYIYADTTDNQLNTNIYLTARPRFSLGFNTDVSHSNIQDFGVSFSTSLISRNVFRGAETLEVAARGTLGSSREANNSEDRFFNISEIGGDIRLNFPRFFFPLKTEKLIPNYMLPETRISVGTSIQTNIGLDKQSFNNVLRYSWTPDQTKKNVIELVNIQYIRNVNIDNFFNVYEDTYNRLNEIATEVGYPAGDNLTIPEETNQFITDVLNNNVSGIPDGSEDFRDVLNISERQERLTDNNLIFASSFTHTRNNRVNFEDNSFSQFRLKLESAGNVLSAASKIIDFDQDESGNNLVFGVQYSQYIKTEFDYVKYWELGSKKEVLAFRSFFGFAIPFGNANSIPFSQSYFGGGSNDNRAWAAYALGPGTTRNFNDFNEANLKLAFNLEYRFNIFGSFNGAFFADAGNIWNALDNVTDEKAVFEGFSSLEELALGTGFGLRYDLSFFVIRFDTGFKTYNPANELGKRWFREYNFGRAVFNIGINYPF